MTQIPPAAMTAAHEIEHIVYQPQGFTAEDIARIIASEIQAEPPAALKRITSDLKITKPFTLAEICELYESQEYNAEMLLQHLLLHVSTGGWQSIATADKVTQAASQPWESQALTTS